jgi:2-phosphoglycerate kinase
VPETIVIADGHGLPYSKGLMAQSLSATGLSPERAFDLARVVERRLEENGVERIEAAELGDLTEQVLGKEQGDVWLRRFRHWRRLDTLERPLVVLIGGTTGVGKSTVATMLAARLGINRVIATDVVRQVLRAFFTHEAMPSVHFSAFEAGGVEGYGEQAAQVATGIAAIMQRAADEAKPVVVEGVHVVPGTIAEELRERCAVVEALVVVPDPELHRGHFTHRPGSRPPERYLRRFGDIRVLQDHLTECARAAGVAVIENESADETLAQLMQLVLDTVGRIGKEEGS